MDSRIKTDGRFLKEASITGELLNKLKALNEIAGSRGQSLAQMALSWVLRDEEVTSVLIGASKAAQIAENAAIIHAQKFTKDELEAIEQILS